MKFNYEVRIKHIFFLFVHFLLLGALVLFSYLSYSDLKVVDQWSEIVTLIAIALLLIQIISLKLKGIEYTDFRLWFLILTYLFMFGRVFLHALNLDENIFWNLIMRYPEIDMFRASMFILCSIQSIFIGFVIKDCKKNNKLKVKLYKLKPDFNIYKAGIILLIFSLPFRLITDINWIIQTQGAGSYSAIQSGSGLSDDFAFLFLPSIILLICSGKLNKSKSNILVSVVIIYFIIVMILTGDRRYPVTAILALVLCYLKYYNLRISFVKTVLLGYIALTMLNLFTVVREVRHDELTSLFDFILNYWSKIFFNTNTVYETLAEFGLTFFSVVHIFMYVPYIIPFQRGFTFVATIPSILPIGWLFRDFFSKSSVSGIINPQAGASVGASLIGDLYANFGWYALGAGIIVGIIFNKIFNVSNEKNIRLKYVQYFSLFYILINLVRATFFEVFRSAIMVYFVPMLIIWIVKNMSRNNVLMKER